MAFPDDVDASRPSPLEQLQIAFAAQIARDIVSADRILDIDEVRLLMMVFPDDLMRSCHFLDAGTELTDAFHRAYVEALRVLPRVLDRERKLDLVTLFHRTCAVDGEIHPSEVDVLKRAARTLEIDDVTLDAHLASLQGSLTSLSLG